MADGRATRPPPPSQHRRKSFRGGCRPSDLIRDSGSYEILDHNGFVLASKKTIPMVLHRQEAILQASEINEMLEKLSLQSRSYSRNGSSEALGG